MKTNSLYTQIVSKLTPETLATFTPTQLESLKIASQQLSWKGHTIDIRLSIPFPGKGFYVVFLAGKERRSRQRLQLEHRRVSHAALLAFVLSSAVFGSLVVIEGKNAVRTVLTMVNDFKEPQFYPTAIPWLTSRSACENTGRFWQHGQCWDKEHSPDF